MAGDQQLCFEGLKIALTGVFPDMSREDMEDLILSNGGKLSGAVSGKTSFLVAGDFLEDGRPAEESSKYRAAKEKNVRIISAEEVMARISAAQAKASVQQRSTSASVKPQQPSAKPAPFQSFGAVRSFNSNSSAVNTSNYNNTNSQLWVDKYKPDSVKHMIGSNEIVSKLTAWLKRFVLTLISSSTLLDN